MIAAIAIIAEGQVRTRDTGLRIDTALRIENGNGMLLRAAGVALTVLLLAASVGCASPKPPPAEGLPGTYAVGPPDNLLITIYPDPILQQNPTVRIDGMISVDLIGDVQAEGRTTEQIAQEIESRIARFKRNAVVTVAVATAASKTITMFGEVRNPGLIVLNQATRLAEAVGQQGGPTIFSRKNRTRVIRSDGTTTEVIRVCLADIMRGDLSTNILLKPGDIVVVPPNVFAIVGYALQTILFPFAPLTGAATTGANAAGLF